MTGLTAEFLSPLFSDAALAELIGTRVDIEAMLSFQSALVEAQADWGRIDKETAARIVAAVRGFEPDVHVLGAAALRDGSVANALVSQLKTAAGSLDDGFVDFGATAQDAIDTALAMKMHGVFDLFDARLRQLLATLDTGVTEVGNTAAVWRGLIDRAHLSLGPIRSHVEILSLSYTDADLGDKAAEIRRTMAHTLGLTVPDYAPHAARDRIASLGAWLVQVTGALGKIGRDFAETMQGERLDIATRADALVALARYNAVQISGLQQAMLNGQERSRPETMLEWLILPQMLNATGTALLHAQALLDALGKTVR